MTVPPLEPPLEPSGVPLTVLILAKAPEPGRSKTRLAPVFGVEGAARLAAAALADTLAAVRATPGVRPVLVLDGVLSPSTCPELAELAELVGLVDGLDVVPQVSGTHAVRIAAAFDAATGPALLIGMDTPQVTPALLALDLAGPNDAWLGLAEDGGWWALGLRDPRVAGPALDAVPMSTPDTGRLQLARLRALGLQVADLPVLRDVDHPQDAEAVAALAPASRFAAQFRALRSIVA